MSQQHESIWGTINTTLEIAINIFYLAGEKGSGLKMPASYGDNPKMQKFLEMSDRDGDYLYFPETGTGFEELKETVCKEYASKPMIAEPNPAQDNVGAVCHSPEEKAIELLAPVHGLEMENDYGYNDDEGFEP